MGDFDYSVLEILMLVFFWPFAPLYVIFIKPSLRQAQEEKRRLMREDDERRERYWERHWEERRKKAIENRKINAPRWKKKKDKLAEIANEIFTQVGVFYIDLDDVRPSLEFRVNGRGLVYHNVLGKTYAEIKLEMEADKTRPPSKSRSSKRYDWGLGSDVGDSGSGLGDTADDDG